MDTLVNQYGLARDFGFDITMPDGNVGLPGAAHKEYLDKCHVLYKEFINNMTVHLRQENELKKELSNLHKEKMQNIRFSLYRSAEHDTGFDPFAKKAVPQSVSPMCWESRNNTPWGLGPVPDEDEENESQLRPQTAPVHKQPTTQTEDVKELRPKTAGFVKTPSNIDDGDVGVSGDGKNPPVVGWVDTETERTLARKITISPAAFAKLSLGEIKAKLKNKHGQFVMRPVKDAPDPEKPTEVSIDPRKSIIATYDPLSERRALVRKVTSYKTPTIATDMKINNRIPIQKSLKGEDANRITVTEIYQNARDRKSRHFRVVTKKSKNALVANENQNQTEEIIPDTQDPNHLSVERRPYSRLHSRNENYHNEAPRTLSRLMSRDSPLPFEDLDNSGSGYATKLRHGLHPGHGKDMAGSEIQRDQGRDSRMSQRSFAQGSRLAFARPDSQLSQSGMFARGSMATPDLSESFSGLRGMGLKSKTRKEGGDARPPSRESKTAFVAAARAVLFAQKMRRRTSIDTSVSNISRERAMSQLSFVAPVKVGTRQTSQIIKEQKQRDSELDAKMTTWRRRMVAGSGGRRVAMSGLKRGGKR